jgi:DNA-binding NtrC family response regulator
MNGKATILYVDDEEINVMLFELSFEDSFTVITANSGQEGLKKIISRSDIKAVISDMRMPMMNGVEFISKVKQEYPEIPCFILTGYDVIEEISNALRNGLLVKYFRKPFEQHLIEDAVSEAIKKNTSKP